MRASYIGVTLALLLCGCRTAETKPTADHQERSELPGLAQAGVLVTSLPLLPIASAYHAISGDIEKDHERTRALHRQYDPVYEQRIPAIHARKPELDAQEAFRSHVLVLLPHTQNAPMAHTSAGCCTIEDREKNWTAICASAFLKGIMDLVDTDPLDHGESRWNSDVYRRYLDVAAAYRVAFNDEMLRWMTCQQMPQLKSHSADR